MVHHDRERWEAEEVQVTALQCPFDAFHLKFHHGVSRFGVGYESRTTLDESPSAWVSLYQSVSQAIFLRSVVVQGRY